MFYLSSIKFKHLLLATPSEKIQMGISVNVKLPVEGSKTASKGADRVIVDFEIECFTVFGSY